MPALGQADSRETKPSVNTTCAGLRKSCTAASAQGGRAAAAEQDQGEHAPATSRAPSSSVGKGGWPSQTQWNRVRNKVLR